VAAGWAANLLLGRDTVGLHDVQTPRATFTSAVRLAQAAPAPDPRAPRPVVVPAA